MNISNKDPENKRQNNRSHRERMKRVSAKRPCPACGEKKRCLIAEDGSRVHCYRESAGSIDTKTDKTGATYHVHLRGARRKKSRAKAATPSSAGSEQDAAAAVDAGGEPAEPIQPIAIADLDTRHAAYSIAFGQLKLTENHREHTRERGFSDEHIDYLGYGSLTATGAGLAKAYLLAQFKQRGGVETLKGVPGFFAKDSGHQFYSRPGLAIPCRAVGGRIAALQVRLDNPTDGEGKYAYASSSWAGGPGPGCPVHVPLGIVAPTETLIATEGVLKADYCTVVAGMPAISFAGVDNCLTVLPVLRELQAKIVRLAFDADCRRNAQVARNLVRLVQELIAAGFVVEILVWDLDDGKGIDDLLKGGKKPSVVPQEKALETAAEILAEAEQWEKDHPKPKPAKAVTEAVAARLAEVLAAGGAKALFADAALLESLARLSLSDKAAFAGCRAILRESKVGLHDFGGAIKSLRDKLAKELPAEFTRGETGGFFEDEGCICRTRQTADGPTTVPLCNFTASIDEEIVRDDGVENQLLFGITGKTMDGQKLRQIEVPASKFPFIDKWVVPMWGRRAIPWSGEVRALPSAIQSLSRSVVHKTVFTHNGWRKINDVYVYLHGTGAIGPPGWDGQVNVDLPSLTRFGLPSPVTGEARVEAVRASLRMLDDLAPDRIVIPIFGMIWRAVLAIADFTGHLVGPTGVFKSELTALCQQHFGAGLDSRNLPGSWSSTENALESVAFSLMHSLFAIDDFAPNGDIGHLQQLNRKAERLIRAQGNGSGRQRMNRGNGMQPSRPPRGLILSTGEDTPSGQSVRGRLLTLAVSPGDVKVNRLTECQCNAEAGMYAQAMACFLQWLAPQYAALRNEMATKVREVRDEILRSAASQHARTPGITADLIFALRLFFRFARECEIVTAGEQLSLESRAMAALIEAGNSQTEYQSATEPTRQFVQMLSAAISAGRAHVAGPDGLSPYDSSPAAWGWRFATVGTGEYKRNEWQPKGDCIGWVEGTDLYLEPDASFSVAQRMAGSHGTSIAVSAATLRRRLSERGLLVNVGKNTSRNSLLVRKTLGDGRKNVLHLQAELIIGREGEADSDSGEFGQSPLTNGQCEKSPLTTAKPFAGTDCAELGSLVSAHGDTTSIRDKTVQHDNTVFTECEI